MDETERMLAIVEALAGAIETIAHSLGPGQMGPENHRRILEKTAKACFEARVIAAGRGD